MVKAVIFDVYGVLVTDGWHPLKHKYFASDAAKNAEATRLNELTNKGVLNYQAFLRQVGELAGIEAGEAQLMLESNVPNIQLFEYITEIKPDYKIGLLSNAAANWLDKLFTSDQLEKFDATVLSCDVQANKPEPKMYEAIAGELGCELSECLFIDDIKSYVDGAIGVGMQALQYKSPKETIDEIKGVLDTDMDH